MVGAGCTLVQGVRCPNRARGEAPDVQGKLAEGELKFVLHGSKLAGSFVLVQMKGRGAKNWLLIKHRDQAARPGYRVTDEQPLSTATGRSMETAGESSDADTRRPPAES